MKELYILVLRQCNFTSEKIKLLRDLKLNVYISKYMCILSNYITVLLLTLSFLSPKPGIYRAKQWIADCSVPPLIQALGFYVVLACFEVVSATLPIHMPDNVAKQRSQSSFFFFSLFKFFSISLNLNSYM